MKLYRSLIYRELRLTRKRIVLMLLLFFLLALLLLIPVFIGGFSDAAESDESPPISILLLAGTIALTNGIMAGTNNGLQKADISSGWKQYSFVLPTTAKQQALSDMLVKLMLIIFFGLLSAAYCLIFSLAAHYNAIELILNIYLCTAAAVMLVDVAYSYIMMFAKDKNDLAVIGVIAFLGAGALLHVADIFFDIKLPDKSEKDGAVISDAAFNRFAAGLGSVKTTLCALAAIAVICAMYYLVMWRSHERREP